VTPPKPGPWRQQPTGVVRYYAPGDVAATAGPSSWFAFRPRGMARSIIDGGGCINTADGQRRADAALVAAGLLDPADAVGAPAPDAGGEWRHVLSAVDAREARGAAAALEAVGIEVCRSVDENGNCVVKAKLPRRPDAGHRCVEDQGQPHEAADAHHPPAVVDLDAPVSRRDLPAWVCADCRGLGTVAAPDGSATRVDCDVCIGTGDARDARIVAHLHDLQRDVASLEAAVRRHDGRLRCGGL
jgi:hypothetical protein